VSQPAAVTFREVEQLLARGFNGRVTLHCIQGQITRYTVEELRIPGAPDAGTPPGKSID
jgi:hypothetical protein